MSKNLHRASLIGLVFIAFQPAQAFHTGQHQNSTAIAIQHAAASGAADVQRYAPTIEDWSQGIGAIKPAEELAHYGTQNVAAFLYNGGPFEDLLIRAYGAYKSFNFVSETSGNEGYYVLLGACVHLIEDQAVPPHAANVYHNYFDKFEGQSPSNAFSGQQGNVPVDQSYYASLFTTQDLIPDYSYDDGFSQYRYWLFHEELTDGAVPGVPDYAGEAFSDPTKTGPGGDGGAYGYGGQDIFADNAGLYNRQVTQAADYAYHFLLNMSKGMPPLPRSLAGTPLIDQATLTGNNSMKVSFHVMENHSPSVYYTARVLDNQGNAKATPANQLPVTPLGFGPDLPYEGNVSFVFSGLDNNGQTLPDGTYTMVITLTDADGISTPASSSLKAPFTITVDKVPPQILTHLPIGSNVSISSPIFVTVTKPLDTNTVSDGIVVLDRGTRVPGTVTFINEVATGQDVLGDGKRTEFVLKYVPASGSLPPGETLTIMVRGTIQDLAGNYLGSPGNHQPGPDFSWSIVTTIPPPSITSQAPAQIRAGKPLTISANIQTFVNPVEQAYLYYRAAADTISPYQKIPMTLQGSAYTATIPGSSILSDQGVDYFIYAVDSSGKASSLPAGITSPDSFTQPASEVVIFAESGNGTLILGSTQSADSRLQLSFRMIDQVKPGNQINLELFETNHDFSGSPGTMTVVVPNAVAPVPFATRYQIFYDGRLLQPANYFYDIVEAQPNNQVVRKIVNHGRFRVVLPLASVVTTSIKAGSSDQLNVAVSGTNVSVHAETDSNSGDAYGVDGSFVGSPPFAYVVPHAASHKGAVYNIGVHEALIGLEGIPGINPLEPQILPDPVGSPQTNGHPISVQCQVVPGVSGALLSQVQLYYRDATAIAYSTAPMTGPSSGGTFAGALPAQAGNNILVYYISATDKDGNVGTSPVYQPTISPYSFLVVVDATPPKVTSVSPIANATQVLLTPVIQAFFSKPIDVATLNATTLQVKDPKGNAVVISSISWNASQNAVSFEPAALQPGTTYSATLSGAIRDISGNALFGGNYKWTFKTVTLLPAALYSLQCSTPNFTMATSSITFSVQISTPVSQVSIVLTNTDTQQEFQLTDSTGTAIKAVYPYPYTYIWNGRVNGVPIPDGPYTWHVEAIDRHYRLHATSDQQPFNWKVQAAATITYTELATDDVRFQPNFDQGIDAHYSYNYEQHRTNLFCNNGINVTLGGWLAARMDESGDEGVFIPANVVCETSWLGYSGYFSATFRRHYVDVSDPPYFLAPMRASDGGLVSRSAAYQTEFDIPVHPFSSYDPVPFSYEIGNVSVQVTGPVQGVSVEDLRVLTPGVASDFDDNPAVFTSINATAPNANTIHIHMDAVDLEPPVAPVIFEVTPPNAALAVSAGVFSQALGQGTTVSFSYSDGLPYGLTGLNLSVWSSTGTLIRTLFHSSFESNGSSLVYWDGTDANSQPVADGTYVIRGQAFSAVGNSTQTAVNVIVDNQSPVLASATVQAVPGAQPLFFGSQDTSIQAAFLLSDDLSPMATVQLLAVNQTTGLQLIVTSTYVVTSAPQSMILAWDGKDSSGNYPPDGIYAMSLRSTDWVGNVSTAALPNLNMAHTPSLVETLYAVPFLFTPDDGPGGQGDGVNDTVTFTYTLSDNAQVAITMTNALGEVVVSGQWTYLKGSGPQTYTWDGKAGGQFVPDGSYVFKLMTTDAAGNQASASVAVVKNEIPAQILFPPHLSSGTATVGGVVNVQGIALQPLINSTTGFASYALWVRSGSSIDFTQPDNNPASPNSQIWSPVPVPASFQSPNLQSNPAYPVGNVSLRSILNGTLGTWDTSALAPGSQATLLLVVKSQTGVTSYDAVSVQIDPNVDLTKPALTILTPASSSPPSNVVLATSHDQIPITYSLTQKSERSADVSLEIFQMTGATTYGSVVYQKTLLAQTTGQTLAWNGYGATGQPVPNGLYRIRLTARDTDHIGMDLKETDIQLTAGSLPPIQILSFQAAPTIVAPGKTALITYQLSRIANVNARALDYTGNVVASYSAALSSDTIIFSNTQNGIYTWQLTATSLDLPTSTATASAAVVVAPSTTTSSATLGGTNPAALNGTIAPVANFRWQTTASGSYFPPQSFTPVVQADGDEVVHQQTLQETAFTSGQNVNTVKASNGLILGQMDETQAQTTDNGLMGVNASSLYPDYIGQSFLVSRDGWISHIQMELFPSTLDRGGGYTFTLELRNDNNGVPGSILASIPFGNVNFKPSGWFGGNVPNIPIVANQRYWLVANIEWLGFGSGGGIALYGSLTNNYPVGHVRCSYGSATTWNDCSNFWQYCQSLAFRVNVNAYAPSGQYISAPVDTEMPSQGSVVFQPFQATFTQPSNTSVQFQMQTSNDGSTWGGTTPLIPGQPITTVGQRYLRTIVNLMDVNSFVSPAVQNYTVNYEATAPFEITKVLPGAQTFSSSSTFIPANGDLSQYFPEFSTMTIISSPTYTTAGIDNSNVTATIVGGPGNQKLQATTQVQQPWTSALDANLPNGLVGQSFTAFNNDPNPNHFTVEAPFNFGTDQVAPLVISTAYPVANMTAVPSAVDQYLFWTSSSGVTTDNPYVVVNAASGGWNLSLTYPDGTPNNTLVLHQDLTKASNTNTYLNRPTIAYDLDDDFSVKLATGGVAPKVFVAIQGNTSGLANGFQSYALFYSSSQSPLLHPIPVQTSTVPVAAGGTLAYWDVTSLHGDYTLELLNLDAGGLSTVSQSVTLGTLVPGNSSQTTYVNGPYNKSYLEFPPGSLSADAVVTVQPQSLNQTNLVFDPNMPQPIGPVFDLEPKNIPFALNPNGTLVSAATLNVRFLPGELAGIDPSQITLYHVTESGNLVALNTQITTESGGVMKMTVPVTSFSYFLALSSVSTPVLDPLPPIVSQSSLTITGKADPTAMVQIFNDGALLAETTSQANGRFAAVVNLVTGMNRISAQSQLTFTYGGQPLNRQGSVSAVQTVDFDPSAPIIGNVAVSTAAFSPFVGEVSTVSFTLSKPATVTIVVASTATPFVPMRQLAVAISTGPGGFSTIWDGRTDTGTIVAPGLYQFLVDAQDAAGNAAVQETITIGVDNSIPDLVLISSPAAVNANGQIWIGPKTQLSVAASIAGVPVTTALAVAIDSGPFQNLTGSFSLGGGGPHQILVHSIDPFHRQSPDQVFAVTLDITPPVTQVLFSPAASGTAPELYLSPQTQVGFVATDAGVGVAATEFRLDASGADTPFETFNSSFTIPAGSHILEFRSTDRAGNKETEQALTVIVDTAPPSTGLFFEPPAYLGPNGLTWISAATMVRLGQLDQGPSLSYTHYRVDPTFATPVETFTQDFTLTGGTHTLEVQSANLAGWLEPIKDFVVQVDTLPPVSVLGIGSPAVTRLDDGLLIISSQTVLTLGATDAGSGVNEIFYALDDAAYSAYQPPITVTAPGPHTLHWYSQDNTGNQEVSHSTSVFVDTLWPESDIAFSPDAYFDVQGNVYISTRTLIAFTGSDVTSSVYSVQFRVDANSANAYQPFQVPLQLPAGIHHLETSIQDPVSTLQAGDTYTLRVDSVPPVSQLLIGSPQAILPDGTLLISRATPIGIQAADQGSPEFMSGVKDSVISISSGPSQVVGSSFTLASAGGWTTVGYYSRDNVLNPEPERSFSLIVSSTVPGAVLLSPQPGTLGRDQVITPSLVPVTANVWGQYLSRYTLEAAPGENAAAGFVLLAQSSSSENHSVLTTWDARALAGNYTLRLTATDLLGLQTVSTANVFLGQAAGTPIDASFQFGQLYVYPNPARGGVTPVFHVETNAADQLTLRIYDLTGREIHKVTVNQPPSPWEYPWDGSWPSGVYFYAVEADKTGSGKLKKTGKFAIVR